MAVGERFKNAWNAFLGRDPTDNRTFWNGYISSTRPDRRVSYVGNERSVIRSMQNQIAVDCAAININHVRINEDGRFEEIIKDELNTALSKDANIDQTGRALIKDIVYSMLDEGVVAVVPTLTDRDPHNTDSYKVLELRVGKILEWAPERVLVELYNELNGQMGQLWFEKRFVAIIENPFYEIMNEQNSTRIRLMRVLRQLDEMNENLAGNKLDLIIQFPYQVKSEAKRAMAKERVKDIEAQLTGSKYGVAYADGTERVIQLNRSLENNLWTQAKELREQLYNELGFSQRIFDGTADEQIMLNYNNRTIEPILSAITEEMERTWLSKTAQSQGQAIRFFRDPFKLVPVAQIAELSDKLTRNEIMSSNEIRSELGLKPSKDPRADELRNSNLNHEDDFKSSSVTEEKKVDVEKIVSKIQNKGGK